MNEAPEKIWAGNDGYANRWDWDTPNDWPEYTRSDIAQAKAASLEVYIMQMEDNLYKLEAEVERLKAALRTMVYETTHLSPEKDDGSHWCSITADALQAARTALAHGEVK
jgi:hypothetical protein